MALVNGLPAPEPLRQITPGHSRADPEQDPVDHLPVVAPTPAATTGFRQMRLKPHPLVPGQISPPHDQSNDRIVGQSQDPPDGS